MPDTKLQATSTMKTFKSSDCHKSQFTIHSFIKLSYTISEKKTKIQTFEGF